MSKIAFVLKVAAIFLVFILLAGGIRAESVAAAALPQAAETASIAPPHMIANPAAKYCAEMGNTFSTETDASGGERGLCTMPDATVCDAWDYLAGKCGQQYSYCATLGLDVATVNDGQNAFSRDYAVCVNELGQTVGAASDLSGLGDTISTCGTTAGPQAAAPQALTTGASASDPNIVKLGALGAPPAAYDWRSATLGGVTGDWTSPIKNQGNCGSCWAYSAVGVTEAALNISARNPGLDFNLAEDYLITGCSGSNNGSCCGGWNSGALQTILASGIPPESDMPSVSNQNNSLDQPCQCFGTGTCTCNYGYPTDPDPTHLCSNANCTDTYLDPGYVDHLRQLSAVGYVSTNKTTIKQALISYGPLSASMSMTGGTWNGDVYNCSPSLTVDHAVSIVGYSDAGSYWIVKNSWGSGWNGNGFFKVAYDQCHIQDAVIYVLGPAKYTISGYVRDAGLAGVSYVRMTFQPSVGSPIYVYTDATGFYTLDVDPGWTGTVTPDKPLYDFSGVTPANLPFTNVNENWLNQDFGNVVFNPDQVLLVDDDDDGPDVSTYYIAALNSLDPVVTYDLWDTNNSDNEPDAATLAGYQAVIWFSGMEDGGSAGPGSAGETALTAYLNGGGSLLISSQDYFRDHGRTTFMTNYLGAAGVLDDVVHNQVTGTGVFSGLGPYTLPVTYNGVQNYSDALTPGSGAFLGFNGSMGGAALFKDNGTYRTAYIGFPLELLQDAERQAVIQRFLAWDTGYLLTLTSSPTAGGSIGANPPADLGTRYAALDPATPVDLTPTANTGYAFDHWTVDATGSTVPATVTMDANHAVTAVFKPCYTLTTTLTPGGYGTVTASPDSDPGCVGGGYRQGTVVTLTATYNPDRDFVSWSGGASGTDLTIDVTMTGNKAITANFTPCYALTMIANPDGEGTVTADPPPTCRDGVLYRLNSPVSMTAHPGVDSSFISWSGSASGSVNPVTLPITANKIVTANFIGCYTLDVNSDPTGGGSVTTSPAPNCTGGVGSRYLYGTSVRVTAATNANYAFSNWSGDASGTSDFFILALTENRTATANFTPCYALDLTMASGGTGTLTVSPGPNCGTRYLSGTTVSLGAVPATYNYFLGWSNPPGGSTTPVSIEMDADKAVTASFITAPTIPVLEGPVSGVLLTTDNVTLEWGDSTPAPNLDHYQLQVATSNTFSLISLVVDETSLGPSSYYLDSLTPNTSYYWRVRAFDAYGHARGWSSLRSFRTALTQPVLVSPVGGESVDTAMPTFTWTPVAGASGYNIQISLDTAFATSVVNVNTTGLGVTYTPATGLPVGVTLHWRVRSLGVNGPSVWSVADSLEDSFTSADPPGQPNMVSPANGFLTATFRPTLTWSAPTTPVSAPAPENYEIQISPSNTFGTIVYSNPAIPSIQLSDTPVGNLPSNTTFYWRVRASRTTTVTQYGIWSTARSFRTPLAAPIGLNLAGTTARVTMPTFSWTSPDLTGVTGFNLQIARDGAFATLLLNKTTTGTTQQYTVTFALPTATPLWWRVRVMGANGPSNWTASSFTSANPPGVPNLLLPGVNALTIDFTPDLTWNATGAVDHYQVQVDDNTDFSPAVADATVGTAALFTTPGLSSNTTYNWRVRSYNLAGDYSVWSAVRTFRTALLPPSAIWPVGLDNVPTTMPALDWSDVAGVTGYNLQVFRDVSLLIPVLNLNLTGTASIYTPTTPLPTGITLYWRVRSLGANGPGDWSDPAGRTFTSSNPPTIPTLVSPAANALVFDYTPALTWTAVTAPLGNFAYYQVQVDNNSNFSSPEVDDTSITSTATTTFSPGSDLPANVTYSWRVRAVSGTSPADYQYSQWSAVRTFRTALLTPVLSAPADAEIMLQTLPAFSWGNVAGVTGYTLQISRNNTFTSMVVAATIPAANSPTITYVPTSPLPPGLQLWWRVNSLGTNGPSEWSAVRTITSANPPGIPNLTLPAANGLSTSYTPTLTWGVVSVPAGTVFDYYQIQLSDTSAFVMPVLIDHQAPTLTIPSFTPAEYAEQLPPNAAYHWRVRSFNSDGQYSQWSAVRTFRTAVLPPVLSAPASLATMLETMPTFSWEASENATGYTIQISRNAGFTSIAQTGSTNASTFSYRPPSALPAGAPLYWRVQSQAVNGPSGWSAVRSFTPANPPGIPNLSLPPASALVTIYQPVFTWARATLPTGVTLDHYQLQISTTSNFTLPVLWDVSVGDLPAPSFTPAEPLLPNATYYWRVRSFNTVVPAQYSQWSAVRSFRTSVLAPALVIPSDGETMLETMPTFSWEDVGAPPATGYTIQISRNSNFTSIVQTGNTNASTLSYKATGPLPVGVMLYWRVQTRAVNGPSGWSEARSFTPANPPGIPSQILPTNNFLAIDYTPTFTWGTVSVPAGTLFASYQVQIDTDNFVDPLLVDDATLLTPTYTAPDLAPDTTYSWRVRSLNVDGQYSQWSTVRTFRTAVLPPVLTAPSDAATMLETLPTFTWAAAANATGYTLQISRNIGFTSLVQTSNTNAATTSYRVTGPLPAGAVLYWRVQTKAVNGPSDWSTIRSFTPANPPGIPNLTSPAINLLTTDFTPTLAWSTVPVPAGVTFMYYEIQIDNSSNLGSPEIVETLGSLTSTTYEPGFDLDPNTTYYWRVRSYNTLSQYSQWSSVRYFRTSVRPPVLALPADAGNPATTLPLFDWDDVPAATGYTIQISSNSGFTSFLVNTSPAGVTSQYTPVSPLAGGQVFYWRVLTKGLNGPSAWSPSSWFTSAYPPGIPSPVSPANNTLVYDTTPVFGWNTVWVPAGAGRSFDYYQIQIDTDTAFDPADVDDDVVTYMNPSYTPSSPLTPNTTYYWRVRSFNVSGQYSQWSTVRTFRTALPAPVLSTPADASSTSDTTPTFDWGDVSGASGYDIQISTSSTFTTTVISTNTVGSTYTPAADLLTVTYYWRVRTRGTNGPSDWSTPVWSVTITP